MQAPAGAQFSHVDIYKVDFKPIKATPSRQLARRITSVQPGFVRHPQQCRTCSAFSKQISRRHGYLMIASGLPANIGTAAQANALKITAPRRSPNYPAQPFPERSSIHPVDSKDAPHDLHW